MNNKKIRFNDVAAVNGSLLPELRAAFERTFEHQQWILGSETTAFEKEWAAFIQAPDSVACSNGTDALILALQALGVGRGHEVIAPTLTFFATIEAIVAVGATPVLVDVLPDTGSIDPACVRTAITPATRAVLPVHLYGLPARIDEIAEISSKNGIFCIEDAAQAHGVPFRGKMLGTWGDAGCFSFYPGKNLGALGDGGALCAADPDVLRRIRSFRDHGRSAKYEHREFASNRRMDGLQSAFLREKLKKMDEWDARRRAVTSVYHEQLQRVPGLRVLPEAMLPVGHGSLHLYVVFHERRDHLAERLDQLGVETGIHYPIPCHLQPAWGARFSRQALPIAERLAATCLSLPLSAAMSVEDARFVADRVKAALAAC